MYNQQFRCGERVISLQVQCDSNGTHYSAMDDITNSFPNATGFKVGEYDVMFLKDENDNLYSPSRIAYFPNQFVDVVTDHGRYFPLSPPESLRSGVYSHHHRNSSTSSLASYFMAVPTTPGRARSPSSPESMIPPFSPMSLSPGYTSPGALAMMGLRSPPDSSNSSRHYPLPSITVFPGVESALKFYVPPPSPEPVVMGTYSATEVAAELSRLLMEGHSTAIMNLMDNFHKLAQCQHDIATKFDKVLEGQDKVLEGQDESKRRDEEMLRQQLQTNDQLKVVQEGIDAVLTQNYELHEYPIPRLFVILPEKKLDSKGKSFFDTFKGKSLIQEKFRLYFLCECGDRKKGDEHYDHHNLDTSGPGKMDEKHPERIHLADHEGYEISRPKKFFEQYGRYVLGVLRVLKVCVYAASVIAPPVVHLVTEMDVFARVAEAVTKNTLDAVNVSIDYLRTNLSQEGLLESSELGNTPGQGANGSANSLKALEGADLRQLDTFLRNKDKDKILGKLYRITTSEGHVKWVCLEHYRYSYNAMIMSSFLRTVQLNQGLYEPYLCKVTITLPTFIVAEDFMGHLVKQESTINELDVTLTWAFNTLELDKIVESICRSKTKVLRLDLSDRSNGIPYEKAANRYRPLLDLFRNVILQSLSLQGIISFGFRTIDLTPHEPPSRLRTYHHLNGIGDKDIDRISNILWHCPNLVDLRLGSDLGSRVDDQLCQAIKSLKYLEVLYLWNFKHRTESEVKGLLSSVVQGTKTLRELVIVNTVVDAVELETLVQAFSRTLEVLILDPVYSEFNLATIMRNESARSQTRLSTPPPPPPKPTASGWKDPPKPAKAPAATKIIPFSKLRQIHLNTDLSDDSNQQLARIMPLLSLTHLGLCKSKLTDAVIKATDFTSVRSVYFCKFTGVDLVPMWKSFPETGFGGSNQIDSISLERLKSPGLGTVLECLSKVAIKRLWIGSMRSSYLKALFNTLNLSKLEVLAIVNCEYKWETEEVLVRRQKQFSDKLRVYLAHNNQCSDVGDADAYKTNTRGDQSTYYTRFRTDMVSTYTNVNDMNLRHKLMVRME
ncbi:hypothetical protein EC957_001549 [Mortierella hygrophila]|uniref:RNI-like superfamily protein n=1 Tax=Mortierella hygrophila TaxID=979708 RepID=A0A9P6K729_9FUNG|nr:hypothetical protein EC957_001549 [Mortierella hygrophila]